MHRRSPWSVWLLLVTVVAGTLVAPAVHHIGHASEYATATEAARDGACHIDAAHNAEAPVLAAERLSIRSVECDLCATRLSVASLRGHDVPRLRQHLVGTLGPVDARISIKRPRSTAIRGPPIYG